MSNVPAILFALAWIGRQVRILRTKPRNRHSISGGFSSWLNELSDPRPIPCSHYYIKFEPDGLPFPSGREVCLDCKGFRVVDGDHCGPWQQP